MEFGMKRVMASVQAVAVLERIYCGKPVPLATLSKESKLSVSYLEQIFKRLRSGCAAASWSPHTEDRAADIAFVKVISQFQQSSAQSARSRRIPRSTRFLLHLTECLSLSWRTSPAPNKHKTRARRVQYPVSRPKLSGIEF